MVFTVARGVLATAHQKSLTGRPREHFRMDRTCCRRRMVASKLGSLELAIAGWSMLLVEQWSK